jgi:hypothetical protein
MNELIESKLLRQVGHNQKKHCLIKNSSEHFQQK